MRRRTWWLASAVALSLGVACPDEATAQSPAEIQIARQTAQEGLAAYKTGEYDKAVRLFEQARAVYASAQILRMHGYTLLALKQWEKAAEAMEAALSSGVGPLGDDDKKDVQEQLAKATAHLGTVTVKTTASDAELVVDGGEPIPLPLSKPLRLVEGRYKLTVKTPEHPDVVRDVEIPGGTPTEIDMSPAKAAEPEAPPPPPPKPAAPVDEGPRKPWFSGQHVVGFGALGAGVALGAAALITAVAGAGIRSQVEEDALRHDQLYGRKCEKADLRLCNFDRAVINSDADRADSLRDTSVVLGISAGVLAASGAVLLVFYPWGGEAKKGVGREADRRRSVEGPRRGPRKEMKGSVGCNAAPGLGLSCAGTF